MGIMDGKDKDKEIKKCTRCRVKRTDEPAEQLAKYSTCFNCRNKRKVNKAPEMAPLPGGYFDFNAYLDKLKFNNTEEMHELKFRGQTRESEFPRPDADEDVAADVYQHYANTLTERYIMPISQVTGYKFAVRDYHKGGRKIKKITFTFICSQDKGRQRKSRSNQERNVNNKLKTEYCGSRLALTYNLNDGYVNISYSHKPHEPYGAMKLVRASRAVNHPTAAEIAELSTQLPPLQMPVRPLDYNLGSVAQYNTQIQLAIAGDRTQKDDQVFSDQYMSSDKDAQAAQALAAVAAASAQYKDKISVENIDKDLIGLNE